MSFVAMPQGRPSIWRSRSHMPDESNDFIVTVEVHGDEEPGEEQISQMSAIRKTQVQYAVMATPLINNKLKASRRGHQISAEDLCLVEVRMPRQPATEGWCLVYRDRAAPSVDIGVSFKGAVPVSVWLDDSPTAAG